MAALNNRAPAPHTSPTTRAPPMSRQPKSGTPLTGRIGSVPSTAANVT
jgi:hypothetical protein